MNTQMMNQITCTNVVCMYLYTYNMHSNG